MILSVSQSFRCRAIYASDLLFLRKKSPVVPIHQNCLLLLSTLKKPADQPLHVSTSVENLKFKCETAAMSAVMMKKKKNITGVYLATRWAVPNLVYQQQNALALTPYPTLSIMTLNLSLGKAGYAAWGSIRDFFSWSTIQVVNKSRRDIDEIWIEQKMIQDSRCEDLKAGDKKVICENLKPKGKKVIKTGEIKKYLRLEVLPNVIISAGSEEIKIIPEAFIIYKRLVFYTDSDGKLAWEGES